MRAWILGLACGLVLPCVAIAGDGFQWPEAHEELLAYLDAHREEYWTATFLDTWVRARQAQRGAASP